jgi:hypothetical protein
MSDQIQLAVGAKPWLPSYDAEMVEEYAHYDMPLNGVVSQSGCFYLFECIEGAVEAVNIWIYAPLLEREEDDLSRLSSDSLSEAMDEIWRSRDVVVALAVDDKIFTGATISSYNIDKWGIRTAAFNEVRSLLERERLITGALESVKD